MLSILVAGVVAELLMLPALLAGPLGVVFKAHPNRHGLLSRLYIIARYELRRMRHTPPAVPVPQPERTYREAA